MDKRTLIFLFGMTALFFLMHQWFDFGTGGSAATTIGQPSTQVVISSDGKPLVPLTETEKQQLQVVRLYRDVDLKEFLTYGIHKENSFLSIASEVDLPEQAYLEMKNSKAPIPRRVQLVVKPEKVGDPILYSVYALSKLNTPWVPEELDFKVLLIYFDNNNVYKVQGQALGVNKLILSEKPTENALALFEYQGKNEPYAFYDVNKNQLNYLNHLSTFENYSVVYYPPDESLSTQYKDQTYYTLENEFMQLVFSNINGAISEVNLPFHSEKHPTSVVREIETDRIIAKNYPENDLFPKFNYLASDGKGGTQKMRPVTGGYYPLLRRDIIGRAGDVSTDINPHYYAFNVFEDDKISESKTYKLKRFEKNLIEFELVEGNRRITKIYTLPNAPEEAPYTFDLSVKVDGDARNLFINLGIPEVELISGSFSPTLKYRITRNQKPKVEEIKPPKGWTSFPHVNADWYANGNGFFGIILDPIKKNSSGLSVHPVSGELVPTRLSIIDSQYERYPPNKYPGYSVHAPIMSKPGVSNFRIFAGPFDKRILGKVDQALSNPVTGYNPDFTGAKSYHGWFAFISQPFAKFLFVIMDFFHSVTHSWGFSIILLTIVLRLMLYPLNNWSMKSTAKLQKIAPQVKEIQEKYKKDPKRVQMETMALYRRAGANPFGGCLPMIVQMPFLFGMFDLLKTSFELRGAPFIPGWINNLTAPDVLFSWQHPIPFIGTSFHLLPFLLGGIMYFQQKLMSGRATGGATDQQKQARSMGNIMTIVFTVLFYHFPSGLNIYWISSMLLGVFQQWWVTKQIEKGK